MDFSEALKHIKQGFCATRKGWNGKGQYICLFSPNINEIKPYIAIRTVDADFVPWVASQTDMLANDWVQCDLLSNNDKSYKHTLESLCRKSLATKDNFEFAGQIIQGEQNEPILRLWLNDKSLDFVIKGNKVLDIEQESYIDEQNLKLIPIHDIVTEKLPILEKSEFYQGIKTILLTLTKSEKIDFDELIQGRKKRGLETYGTYLYPGNGRDPLKDCIEEIADGLIYYAQFLIKTHDENKFKENSH